MAKSILKMTTPSWLSVQTELNKVT